MLVSHCVLFVEEHPLCFLGRYLLISVGLCEQLCVSLVSSNFWQLVILDNLKRWLDEQC